MDISIKVTYKSISIHALREEGDIAQEVTSVYNIKFLSTPSARRATHQAARGRDPPGISIHALREEGDRDALVDGVEVIQFLSTPSARRATIRLPSAYPPLHISVHALREEGDTFRRGKKTKQKYFYPRPPRGGRH